jgi:hypothetical protein
MLRSTPTLRWLLLILLVNAAFFLPGILRGEIYSPSEIMQRYAPLQIDGDPGAIGNEYDVAHRFEPHLLWLRASLARGELPLWLPLEGGGRPMLAHFESGFLYPPTALYVAASDPRWLFLYYWSKLALIGLFTFLFLRAMRVGALPAFLGSVAFTFSGFPIAWLYWQTTNVVFFLPLSLWCLECYLQSRRVSYLGGLAVGAACAFFAGHPGTLIHLLVIDALYLLLRGSAWPGDGGRLDLRALGAIMGAYLLGWGLAGVQLVPAMELILGSDFFAERETDPLALREIFLQVFPYLKGHFTAGYWFGVGRTYPELASGYIGLTMLAFAAFGRDATAAPGYYRAWIVIGLVCLVAAYRIPFLWEWLRLIPIVGDSNLHRLQAGFSFAMAVAGAMGIDRFLAALRAGAVHDLATFRRRRRTVLGIAGVFLVAGGAAVYLQWPYKQSYATVFLLAMAPVALANLLGVGLFDRLRSHRAVAAGIVALVLCETWLYSAAITRTSDPRTFYPETPAVSLLREALDGYRLRSVDLTGGIPPNVTTAYGLHDARIHTNLRHGFDVAREPIKEDREAALLCLLGTRYFIGTSGSAVAGFLADRGSDMTGVETAHRGAGWVLMERQAAMPRAYLADSIAADDLLRACEPQGFTPPPAAAVLDDGNGRVRVEVGNAREGQYVVVSDNFYPGWQATVNGEPRTIEPTGDLAFRAVRLKEGRQVVEMEYAPGSVKWGAVLSAVSTVLLGILLLSGRRRKPVPTARV